MLFMMTTVGTCTMQITSYAHWTFPVFDESCNKTSLKFTFIQIAHKIAII